MAKKTLLEQIKDFEATRAAKAARMNELMEAAAEKSETLDAEGQEEYDTLEGEIKQIDAHLRRLETLQKANVAAAKPVEKPETADEASTVRGGGVISVRQPELPKGTAFTRYAIALACARGNKMEAVRIARRWKDSTPQVEAVLEASIDHGNDWLAKAAVAAGTTVDSNWAAPLVTYQQMASEFVEYLRPLTIIGRVPGLRRVPFNIQLPRQTAGSSVGWVNEGAPKPVSKLQFDTLTLRFHKAAGIVVMTDELVRFSNPAAEGLVRDDLARQMAQFLDEQFVDPSKAAIGDTSPASITNGANNDAASGTTAADLRDDLSVAFAHLENANLDTTGLVLLMKPHLARKIGMMQNALGQPEFVGVNQNGGTLFGAQVITSNSVGSGYVIMLSPGEILFADDGGVAIDVSREASLQMESEPSVADFQTVSLWQTNMVGIRAERFITWKRRRDEAVYYITGASYGSDGSV